MIKNYRKTKILATIGPSSERIKKIEELVLSGVDAFRINCSHATHSQIKNYVENIRKVEKKLKKPIGILIDLQGPKLRIGEIENNKMTLKKGQKLFLTNSKKSVKSNEVPLPEKKLFKSIKVNHPIFIDDGKIKLKVVRVSRDIIETKVMLEGILKSNKGLNLPETILKSSALTVSDKKNVKKAIELDVDWIALSFIQSPEDIISLKKLSKNISIIAKIEKPRALNYINEITRLADGLMIARGDLGVELPIQDVPGWQKKIIREARIQGKPVIVSTQMLESMITSKTPTRAEVSDVATAVFEGSDAVMLSAESATGDNPELAVKMMDKIAHSVEKNPNYSSILSAQLEKTPDSTPDAIATAARSLATELNSPIIVCYTESGSTGIKVSRVRPKQMILTVTPIIKTARKLTLVWGVKCIVQKDANNLEEMIKITKNYSKREKIIKVGEKMVVTAGLPLKKLGTTNLIRVIKVD
jgi:pyruvate kinase|tara:strand:- start:314 stop:1729 length:1416 start_codon:yes stop_codon:yes gene_type:complete